MRRLLVVLLLVAGITSIWAGAQKEDAGTITVTVLGTHLWNEIEMDALWAEAMKPQKVAARWIAPNISDGTTISMDLLVAAGAYPNVYFEFTGRASRYMVRTAGWKAMDLTPYVDVKQYYDLKPWMRNGMLLGVPAQIPLQGMGINVDILKEANFPVPAKNWTIADFIRMCQAVSKLSGKYGTALFAKSASADYLWMNWFGSFGAQVFTDGDYTKTTLNSPQGIAAVRFMGDLVKRGYAPKDSADLWDDAALELWQKGLVAAMPIRPDWISLYMKSALEQGMLNKPFEYTFLPFPRGPGVDKVPTLGAGSTAVVYDSGNTAIDRAAGKLAALLAGKEYQTNAMTAPNTFGSWPTRRDVDAIPKVTGKDLEGWKVVNEILGTAGIMDVGYTLPGYSAIRAELFPRMAALYTGKETPEEVLAKFEKTVNEILNQ